MTGALPWEFSDGGREASGRIGSAGDCVTRAVAIASGLPYGEVYAALAEGEREQGRARSARRGVARKVYEPFLLSLGFVWVPTMSIGSGCRVHLREGELPSGRVVARLSGHLTAVIDGTILDTFDPSRDGKRCVYGFYKLA